MSDQEMKRYDTMGFESEYGVYVRSADADAVRAENVALRAEVEKWKACRVHDVEEKEWLREQMIALRAVLGDQTKALSLLYNRYNDRKGIPYILSEECRTALDRARALLAEGKA
jgi:hypothetical protein